MISGNVKAGVTQVIGRGQIIRGCSTGLPGSPRIGGCVEEELRGHTVYKGYPQKVKVLLDMTMTKRGGSWKVSTFNEIFSYR